jgi:multidrug efflux pump
VTAQSRLQTAEQFGAILLKTTTNGATVHLRDVARMELGSETYNILARYNGKPASAWRSSWPPAPTRWIPPTR